MYSTPAIRSLFLRKGGRILATSPQDSASTGLISTQATKAGSYDVCRVAGSGCASSWPTSGGSPTTSTVIGAIATATDKAMQAVLKAAPRTTNSPFAKTDPQVAEVQPGAGSRGRSAARQRRALPGDPARQQPRRPRRPANPIASITHLCGKGGHSTGCKKEERQPLSCLSGGEILGPH